LTKNEVRKRPGYVWPRRSKAADHSCPTGAKVAGHRGFFLTGYGVDLNQALITYGLQFLHKKKYKKIMPPFMMRRSQMSKTAQLEEFDEALYKACFMFPFPTRTSRVKV
jgi:seryl-tRNA synthetase